MSLATSIATLTEAVLAVLRRPPATTDSLASTSLTETGQKIPTKDIVDAICQERHGLRLEVIEMESSMHRSVLAFVTVAGIFAGIYWDKRVIPDEATRAILLAGITQIEFFLALFLLSLFVNQNVHVGYIRALEEKINRLCGITTTAWDSQITRNFLGHSRAAFFWMQAFLFLILASFFIGATRQVSRQIGRPWVTIVAIGETAVVVLFAIWGLLEVGRVQRSADKVLGNTLEVQADSKHEPPSEQKGTSNQMATDGAVVGNRPGRLKRLIFNLFYPAALGTFFVSLLPAGLESFRRGIDLSADFDWKLLIALLIVAHFVVDYMFTEEIRLYKAGMFILDLLVIFLLYMAYSSVHIGHGGVLGVRTIALSMSGVYLSFLLWEYLERKEIGRQPVMTAYEGFFAIWFLIVGIFWQSPAALGLSLLAATAMMIIICGGVLRGYHAKQHGPASVDSNHADREDS